MRGHALAGLAIHRVSSCPVSHPSPSLTPACLSPRPVSHPGLSVITAPALTAARRLTTALRGFRAPLGVLLALTSLKILSREREGLATFQAAPVRVAARAAHARKQLTQQQRARVCPSDAHDAAACSRSGTDPGRRRRGAARARQRHPRLREHPGSAHRGRRPRRPPASPRERTSVIARAALSPAPADHPL